MYVASGMSFEDVKRSIEDRANTDRIPLAVVALDGGRVIGTGCLKVHDMDTRTELTPWLAGIYVELKQRGKDIGSKIDGFVKSPTSALCCILRHCGVL